MIDQTNPPPLTRYPCYGAPRQIVLSWSRLSDWVKCNRRVRLIFEGKKSKLSNARNFLAGKVTDLCMRHALEEAPKDSAGRILSLSMEDLFEPLPEIWDRSVNKLEKNTIMKWKTVNPTDDQKQILSNVNKTLKNLYPILQDNVIGKRAVPELRPKEMPVIGIPGPDGETCYIRLFLAVDCAVQIEEDPDNPMGVGKWGLYDLKTTSTVEYLEKTLPQLVFYDIAFHALTGHRPVDHALWAPLVNEPVRRINVTDEHRMMLMDWIVSYCHGVWAGKDDFTKDDSNCYTCSTKTACPKVTLPMTKDEQGLDVIHFGDLSGGKLHG